MQLATRKRLIGKKKDFVSMHSSIDLPNDS
jgi:hypothetical protein